MPTFKIIPILGLRNDIPADDKRLFTQAGEGVAYCNCVEGENFDLARKRGVCSKSYGYNQYSNTANSQATLCQGLFELYDGTNRDHIMIDKGKVFVYDGSLDPADVSGAITLSTSNICSMVRVGSHIVIADGGTTTPYCWKHADAGTDKALSGGTEFKFRYLVYFMQRLVGLYSDQTNGDIDIRWSGVIPVPGTTCEMAAGNQIYIPTDDSITGAALMGQNACYVYCDNSIHQMIFYQNYVTPFQLYTVVSGQGCIAPHSIVAFPDRHYMFNRNYGFCEYRGGNVFPYGEPISQPIESIINSIDLAASAHLIVGKFVPWRKQIVWTIPADGNATCNKILCYDLISKQWTMESILARYMDVWSLNIYDTLAELETAFGLNIADLDPDNKSFAYYDRSYDHFMFANTDGHTYTHETDSYDGSHYTGYRVEPILDFGNPRRTDLLGEIWFDLASSANIEINLYWRGGDTVGEVVGNAWESIGTISHFAPGHPFAGVNKSARLHQVKWEVTNENERFQVNGITFKFTVGSER
jgi:hypothetical protein